MPGSTGEGTPFGGALPPDEPVEPLNGGSLAYLGGGLIAYVAGFVLLAKTNPDFAPLVIVGGILSMFWAFLR